ncbi:MAG: RagB/SusD family nutrient uptake outer membrane protein [Bacteroidales bacterium]|nr:RagB/SusD family nutrient uptake outer membrane protein [Bacteroidales bacterium]
MKKIRNFTIKVFCITVLVTSLFSSCEDNYLQEIPKGFLSPENTYTDIEGFESGINDLYRLSRNIGTHPEFISGMVSTERDKGMTVLYGAGTDLCWYWNKVDYFSNYTTVNSFNAIPQNYWIIFYSLIKGANVMITRSDAEEMKWDNENDKLLIQAKARFFRALAYRYLVHLFGDVPIIEKEITSPKLDFIRNSKSEVYNFILADLEFASQYLPVANNKDGQLTKAAADHLLAEMYISTGEYDKSIQASSRIINDSQYHLMTERFGTMTDKPGDVFWDLFRFGNQNNTANKEVIWAWQVEFNVPGGEATNNIERQWGPFLEQLKAADGKAAILKDEFLGRPVGFVRPTIYMEYTIWQSDWNNDIRNSEYNMQRKFYVNNPASANYGQVIIPKPADTLRRHFVYVKKASHPEGHPQGYDTEGRLYSDVYAIRFAETYLLRAEAYLNKGEKDKAAADINVVRSRAKATPVDPSKVDIDYILDERARELLIEEPRRLTLARLGLLDDRVKKYNQVSAPSIQEFNNLWPIPQTEIDANVGAELKQNPGY